MRWQFLRTMHLARGIPVVKSGIRRSFGHRRCHLAKFNDRQSPLHRLPGRVADEVFFDLVGEGHDVVEVGCGADVFHGAVFVQDLDGFLQASFVGHVADFAGEDEVFYFVVAEA